MSFAAAHANFVEAARHGMEARLLLARPGRGNDPRNWCCAHCCRWPTTGCAAGGVDAEVRDRFLGVIEGRAKTGRNGASWQVSTVRALQDGGMTRPAALAEMLRRYCEQMHTNEPVHTWPS